MLRANSRSRFSSLLVVLVFRIGHIVKEGILLKEGRDLLILFGCPDSTDFVCFISISLRSSSFTFIQCLPRLWFFSGFLTLFLTIFLGLSIPGGLLFPRRCTCCLSFFGILFCLFTTHCSFYIDSSIISNIVSTSMSACLLWALPPGLCFYTLERSPPDHRAMIEGSPCDGLTATARTSASHRPKIFLLYTPLDLHAIIEGESRGGRTESCRLRMSELSQTSGGHPANFNCELNLPDDRRTSARWGLYWRITAGFLLDSMQNSPRGGHAADFAQLWGRLKENVRER